MVRVVACLFVTALCFARGAAAYTYVMPRDDALLERASDVFVARVAAREAVVASDGVASATRYTLRIEDRHKGAPPAELSLRLPGALVAGRGTHYPGIPAYAVDDVLLVFATRDGDGDYRPVELALGVFAALEHRGARYFVRELDPSGALPSPNAAYGQARAAEAFVRWIERTLRGEKPDVDYLVPAPPRLRAKFTQSMYDFGAQGRFPARWRKFELGQAEAWYALAGGQANTASDELAQLQQALAAWTNEPGSDIRFVYGGTVGSDAPNQSNVVWNDPLDQIPGTYDCNRGGTVAIGGPVVYLPGHVRNGTTYGTIMEGNVIVQAGAGCALDGHGGADGAEALAHEVGHALGFGHSCGDANSPSCANPLLDDALMRALLHADGRGAALRADDVAGAVFVYGVAVAPAPVGGDTIFANGFE